MDSIGPGLLSSSYHRLNLFRHRMRISLHAWAANGRDFSMALCYERDIQVIQQTQEEKWRGTPSSPTYVKYLPLHLILESVQLLGKC